MWWSGLDGEIEKHVSPVKLLRKVLLWLPFTLGSGHGKLTLQVLRCFSVDAHSKKPEVIEMSETSPSRTISVLRRIFATHGLPEQSLR